MRIAVVGAGAMGADIVSELVRREPELALTVVDADGARARSVVERSGLKTAAASTCDAGDLEALTRLLSNATVTVNAAQYGVNLDVMRACLAAGSHYLDLGGMFHITRRQMALGAEFEGTGLTAVLGMGAAPGLSNLLAVAACEGMERIESVDMAFAAVAPDMPESDVFVPPYSIRTIMQEFCDPSFQYVDGELRELPALAGRRCIRFPEPIGEVDCVHTLHSEPATLPSLLAERGAREVTWRLGLPARLEDAVQAFAAAGLGSAKPLNVGGAAIAPVEFLAACIDNRIASAPRSEEPYSEFGCLRAEARGWTSEGMVRVVVECVLATNGVAPDVAGVMTGTPAAVAALMLAKGEAGCPGAHGPERVIDPSTMFTRLADVGFKTSRTERRQIAG
ncbi:MAG: saccharopine dehydrogenase family protein [Gammaproteobacteria bacterium]